MPRKIEISHRTIIFAVLFLLFLWFLYVIRGIILEVFVALLLMAILNPLVSKLSNYRIPRALSVAITYLLVFGVFGAALFSLIPPLIEQTAGFASSLPVYLQMLPSEFLVNEQLVNQLLSQIGGIPSQVLRVLLSVLSNVFEILTILIFAFYLLISRNKLDDQLGSFLGENRKQEIASVIDALEKRLGAWARGQIALMFLVGVLTYIGLTVLGVPYSLPLAILAGLLEIIPYLGPIIAAIPAILIGFGISPLMGIALVVLYFIIQQLESYVFAPKVMESSAGVSPIVTLLSLAIGFRLAGIIGVIIAIPIVLSVQVLSQKYFSSKH